MKKCSLCGEKALEGIEICPECLKKAAVDPKQIKRLRQISNILSITADTDTNIKACMQSITEIEKNEGEKIAYDVSTTKIIFGDDDLMVNIKNRERDEEVTLDICKDTQDGLTVGVNTEAREYVAQVIIPAREYEIVDTGEKDEDGKAITKREPVPFDMKKCTLVLWALI